MNSLINLLGSRFNMFGQQERKSNLLSKGGGDIGRCPGPGTDQVQVSPAQIWNWLRPLPRRDRSITSLDLIWRIKKRKRKAWKLIWDRPHYLSHWVTRGLRISLSLDIGQAEAAKLEIGLPTLTQAQSTSTTLLASPIKKLHFYDLFSRKSQPLYFPWFCSSYTPYTYMAK